VSYLFPKNKDPNQNSPGKPSSEKDNEGMVYKYFSDLEDTEAEKLETRPNIHADSRFV